MNKPLEDNQKYRFMMWVPGDSEYYIKLDNKDYQKALDDVEEYALDNIDSWYVAPNINTINELNDAIFKAKSGTIRILGYSGTGKSTLLRVTVKNMVESSGDNKLLLIDLRSRGNDIGETIWKNKFGACSKATRKLIQCFIDTIMDYAGVENTDDEDRIEIIRSNLKAIHSNYKKLFPLPISAFDDFFQAIKKFSNRNDNYQYGTGDIADGEATYIGDIKKAVFTTCASVVADIDESVKSTLENLLTLCIILQLFSHNITSVINYKARCYLAIDNIEHFIDADIVHAHDIENFLKAFNKMAETQTNVKSVFETLGERIVDLRKTAEFSDAVEESEYQGYNIPPFQIFVKIILVMREVTSYSEDEDFTRDNRYAFSDNPYLITTYAFHAREIIAKKMSFYQKPEVKAILLKHHIEFPDSNDKYVWEAVYQAIDDSIEARIRRGNTLWDRIEDRYSHNVRRITDNLFRALKGKKSVIKDYVMLNKMAADETSAMLKAQVQFGARQIIARLLWDLVAKETNPRYLSRIGEIAIESDDKNEIGKVLETNHGLGRRTATLLSGFPEAHDPLSLTDFLKLISPQKKQRGSCNDTYLGFVADVLFALYRREKEETSWAPLIMLKYRKTDVFTRNELFGTLKEIRDLWNSNDDALKKDYEDRFGIKITKAGRYFALASVEWEYFASKAFLHSLPLFTYSNLRNDITRERVKSFIDDVYKYARNEIYTSFAEDQRYVTKINDNIPVYHYAELYRSEYGESLLFRSESGRYYTHAHRIIRSHISYLESYRYYIVSEVEAEIDKYKLSTLNTEIIRERLTNITNPYEKSQIDSALDISVKLLETISNYIGILADLSKKEHFDKSGKCFYIGGTERQHYPTDADFGKSMFNWLWYSEKIQKAKNTPLKLYHIINSDENE